MDDLQLLLDIVACGSFSQAAARRGAWLDRTSLRAEAARLLQLVGEDIDPDTRLGRLPLAQHQQPGDMVDLCIHEQHGGDATVADGAGGLQLGVDNLKN